MQRVIVKLICDLPHPKDVAATKTIRFTLNGTAFEMDACADDAEKLRASMAPFIRAARPKASARAKASARPQPASRTRSQRKHSRAIRQWAVAQDMPVAARGRIPAWVEEAYAAGQGEAPAESAGMAKAMAS